MLTKQDVLAGDEAESAIATAKVVYIVTTAAANHEVVTECLAMGKQEELAALQAVCSTAVKVQPHSAKAQARTFEAVQRVSRALLGVLAAASHLIGATGVVKLVEGSDWQAGKADDRVIYMQELLSDPQQFWEVMVDEIKAISDIAHHAAKLSTSGTPIFADVADRFKQDNQHNV